MTTNDTSATITVWTKPACQQCRMVKHRLDAAGVPYTEADITAPEHAKDLEHFKGIGYSSAPITEYGALAVPGFIPAEVDRIIAAWRADQEGAPVAPTTEAVFSSTCPDCGGGIRPGQRITRANVFDAWKHAACPKTKFDVDPADVCSDCFTVRSTNGACSC